jgi:protein SCO1/2
MQRWFFIFILGLATLAVSCSKNAVEVITPTPTATAPTQQVFQVRGTVIELLPAEKSLRIKHEAIPGYMPAMTMPFAVKDTNELAGLEASDGITFRLTVTEKEGWIDQLKKFSAPRTNTLPTTGPFRFVRDVDPLNIGDPLPDYRFTNHLGQPVNLGQFRGQALAFTFIFTRCPYPNFCPLMSNNFREVQDMLLKIPNAPTNWHLFTISFDPEWDTPARLKAYAEGMRHDPRHWSFLTGDLVDITAIAEQVGEVFTRDADGPGISHNLRTVVVDARGRVQNIIPENKWKPAELVAEILKATRPTP